MRFASVIINLETPKEQHGSVHINAGKRLVMHKEGGFQVERYTNGIGWTLDNDALTDQQCAVLLDQVARTAAQASKNA